MNWIENVNRANIGVSKLQSNVSKEFNHDKQTLKRK